MSGPIKQKPVPMHFSAHFPCISDEKPSAVSKIGSCDGLTFKTLLLGVPNTEKSKKSKNNIFILL
jgi:hypothetical protein